MTRKLTRRVWLGKTPVGGGAPILVQSMANTDTRDVESTMRQIALLAKKGCEAVRVAVPDEAAAKALHSLVPNSPVPLIADIHFDYRLAIASLEAGMAGLRINPGNIGSEDRIRKVAHAARANGAVIRVGVNSGSLEKDLLERYGHPTPEALVASALRHVALLEKFGFYDIKLSLKSSSAKDTIAAYQKISEVCDYPLHLGVTEAGSTLKGAVKTAAALGVLLHQGIGDTIRVSLTAPPEEELKVAWDLLRALDLRKRGPEIISCPTCGRTEIDLISLARTVEEVVADSEADVKIAVMGCVVNGPGEAREADLGIAGGRDKGIIFRKGEIIRSVKGQEALLTEFIRELRGLLAERASGQQ